MGSSSRKVLKLTLTVLMIGLLTFFMVRHRSQLAPIATADPRLLFSFLVLASLTIWLNGTKLRHISAFFDIRLKLSESFGLASITTTFNNVFFKAGSLVTSNYLKREHRLPYMAFVGSLGADQLILLFTGMLLGTGFCAHLAWVVSSAFLPLFVLCLLSSGLLGLLIRGTFVVRPSAILILDLLARALHALDRIIKNRALFLKLCGINAGLLITLSIRFYIVTRILGFNVSAEYCALFAVIMILVSAIPLIQSDIGTRELAVGAFTELAGLGFEEGLVAAAVDRVFSLGVGMALTLYFRSLLLPSGRQTGF